MPRCAREKSSTGIYHVMLRGINKQNIFIDDEDHEKLLGVLKRFQEQCGYIIYAYCIMDNHIHLLIKEGKEGLDIVFKKIGASFVYWYNWKYNRVGHLFQDRYKSEAVEDERYFLTVIRYIHQNPLKAGITKDISKYKWNSFSEYTVQNNLCSVDFALNIFSADLTKSRKLFVEFNKMEVNDSCLEDTQVRVHDNEANEIINDVCNRSGFTGIETIKKLDKEQRNKIIKILKYKGLSVRQLERLTGISFAIIRRI